MHAMRVMFMVHAAAAMDSSRLVVVDCGSAACPRALEKIDYFLVQLV